MIAIIENRWLPDRSLVITRLKGSIKMQDAIRWQNELYKTSLLIDRPFKFLFDNHGYEFADISVHKAWREFTPRLLVRHGLLVSFLSPQDQKMLETEVDGSKPACYGLAFIHHDTNKMENIDHSYGNSNQRYFSDVENAFHWIDSLEYNR